MTETAVKSCRDAAGLRTDLLLLHLSQESCLLLKEPKLQEQKPRPELLLPGLSCSVPWEARFPKAQHKETKQDCSKCKDLVKPDLWAVPVISKSPCLHGQVPWWRGDQSLDEPPVLFCSHLLIHIHGTLPRQTGLQQDLHCWIIYICKQNTCSWRLFTSAWWNWQSHWWFLWSSGDRINLLSPLRACGISKPLKETKGPGFFTKGCHAGVL